MRINIHLTETNIDFLLIQYYVLFIININC